MAIHVLSVCLSESECGRGSAGAAAPAVGGKSGPSTRLPRHANEIALAASSVPRGTSVPPCTYYRVPGFVP